MNQTVKRIYWLWEYEEEERWINQQSQQGRGLIEASFGRYVFQAETPKQYRYYLVVLSHSPDQPSGQSEMRFLQDMGAEYVCHRGKRVYFRSPWEENLSSYIDHDILAKRLRRYRFPLTLLICAELLGSFFLLFRGMVGEQDGLRYLAIAGILVGMFFLAIWIRLTGTIRYLARKKKGRKT